ncbi:MAG: glycosyltransferase [Planctomycetes bacterium]|nr:glycosyltransferase [Planctomycetota bacterium]
MAYVLGAFPKLSETFIWREVRELERQGVEIVLFAVEASGDPVDADVREHAARTFYAPDALSPGFWTPDARYLWTRPRVSLRQQARLLREFFPRLDRFLKYGWWDNMARSFAREMERQRVDLIHAHFAGLPTFFGLVAAELIDAPFSFSAHARDIFVHPELMEWKAERAGLIVACSRTGRDRLFQLLPLRFHSKVQLVAHGVSLGQRPTPRQSVQQGPPLVLSVGRLEEKKGFPDLLQAFKELGQAGMDARLTIIGDGPEAAALVRMRGELGLESRVEMLGARPHSEVEERLRSAQVLVLASREASDGDRDGIPNVLLEAAAAGVPVAATSAGGIPEFIQHEVTGLLSPPGRPSDLAANVRNLLSDGVLAQRLAHAAREEVERGYDLAANTAVLRGLFERLAGKQ